MENNYPELFNGLSIEDKEKVNRFIDCLAKKQRAERENQKERHAEDPQPALPTTTGVSSS